MTQQMKIEARLIRELEELRLRVAELEESEKKWLAREKALEASEESFRLLYENAPLAYQSLDENGFLLEINQAWGDLLGYGREEVIGKWMGDFFTPPYREKFLRYFPQFKAAGEIHAIEFQMVNKDGSLITVEAEGRIGRDEQGRFRQTHCLLHDITKRKRAEEARERSEKIYRQMFEGSRGVKLLIDPESGQLIDANPAAEHFYGYAVDDLKRMKISDINILPPDRILAEMTAAKTGRRHHFFFKHKLASEEIRDVEVHSSPLDLGNRRILYSIIHDITERRKAEESLDLANKEWERTFDAISDIVMVLDDQHRILRANKATADALGMTAQDLLGRFCFELVHGTKEPPASCPHSLLLVDGREHSVEFVEPRLGGTYDVRVSPLGGQNGQVIGSVHIVRDMTERKQIEENLRISESRLWDLYDNAPNAYFSVGADGLIRQCNRGAEELLGYPRELLKGKPILDLYVDGLESKRAAEKIFQKFVSGEQITNQELQMKKADGSPIWVSLSVNALRDARGRVVEGRSALVDITERKQQEEVRLARLSLMEFADAHTLGELLQATIEKAEALTNSRIGFYVFLEADQETLSLQALSPNTIEHMGTAEGEGLHYDISEAGLWVDCIRERRAVVHNDYAALPHRKGLPSRHAQVVRELVVPVFRGDRIVAILGVGNKPVNYDAQDVSTVSLLADLAWDIAERKMAQDALRASEARFRQLYDEAPMAMFASNRQGQIVTVNSKCLQVLGRDREEVLGRPPQSFLSSEFKKGLPRLRETFWREGRASEVPLQIVRKDGLVRDIVADSVALEDPLWGQVGLTVFRDVTEHKQAQAALLESERRFRVMADSSPAMLWMSGTDALCTFFNKPWLEFRGRSLEEEIGNGWAEGVHPEDLDRCLKTHLSAFEAREEFSIEYRLKRFDNEFRWILAKGVPRFSSQGTFSGYIGSCIDITDRKRAEQDRMRLVTAIEQAGETVIVTDSKGTIEYVNPAFEKTTGYSRRDALGNNPRMLQSGEHDAAFYRGLWETIRRGEVWTGHLVNKRKDGALLHEDATISPVRDLKGNIVNYVAVKRDVTEQREAQQALRKSEQFLMLVFENMNSGLLVLNNRQEIVLANRHARDCLSIKDEMLPTPLLAVFPDAGALLVDAYPWENKQTVLTTPGNRRKVIGFNSTCTPDKDLRIVLFKDITLILENEERRKRAEQLAVVGELAAKLSHEIKNPLASVFLGLQGLRKADDLSEDSRVTLDIILGEVDRLSESIKHVLEAARPLDLSPSLLSLDGLLTDSLRIHRLTACNKGIDIELLAWPHDVSVIADEGALRRVMTNLIQNALDVCTTGDRVLVGWRLIEDQEKKELAPDSIGQIVGIFVADTGPGVPEDVTHSALFRPFFTTKQMGTGLGLAVVYDLVERHGGVIRINRSGNMTVFEVLLPAGDRVPCWESSCSDACGAPAKQKDCRDCEIYGQAVGYFCWTIKGRAARAETGVWPNVCLSCRTFRERSLSYSSLER